MTDLLAQAASLLSVRFTALDVQATADGSVVRLAQWPTVEIAFADVVQQVNPAGVTIAQFDVRFAFNASRPDTFVYTDCAGWGTSDETVLNSALDAWLNTAAPPILSVLYREARFGAQWFPDGDAYGLSGWNIFSSSYVFRGNPEEKTKLQREVERQPLLAPIREALVQRLDRASAFHYVTVYLSERAGRHSADCYVDGEDYRDVADRLLAAFPVQGNIEFASVRQSLFCMPVAPRQELV